MPSAQNDIHIKKVIFRDEVTVALVAVAGTELSHLAIRWNAPQPCRGKDGGLVPTTNLMGGETDWFILPFTFAVGIARSLIELKVSGMTGFDEEGFRMMVDWMVEMECVNDAMCY